MPNPNKIATELLRIEVAGDRLMLMRYNIGPNEGSLGLGIDEPDGEGAAIILPKEAALALADTIANQFGRIVLSIN